MQHNLLRHPTKHHRSGNGRQGQERRSREGRAASWCARSKEAASSDVGLVEVDGWVEGGSRPPEAQDDALPEHDDAQVETA
jgi:hypothetical protein